MEDDQKTKMTKMSGHHQWLVWKGLIRLCNSTLLSQIAVTAYFTSKQLLLFDSAFWKQVVTVVCLCISRQIQVQMCVFSQKQSAVTVHFTSKQLLLFVFARRSVCQYSMAEENPAAQRQTAVTAYFLSKHLLLFVFARRSVWQDSMARESCSSKTNNSSCTLYM